MRKSATKSRDVCYGPGKFTIRRNRVRFPQDFAHAFYKNLPRAFSCLSQWKLPTATNGRDFSREIDRKVHRQNWINLIHCFFVGWSYEYWLSFYIFPGWKSNKLLTMTKTHYDSSFFVDNWFMITAVCKYRNKIYWYTCLNKTNSLASKPQRSYDKD